MEKSIVSGNFSVVHEDILKCEILSRLPVKSLMRFKCVSKTWLSLIEQDPYFADLHFQRSKARPALLFVIPLRHRKLEKTISDELILTANISRDGSQAEVHNILKTQLFSCNEIYGPVNGLVCFVDRANCDVRVYNISTREVTERIGSTLIMRDPREFHSNISFGFDPVTRKHKVVCVYRTTPQDVYKPVDDYKAICEVLTVGENVWRRIDEVPPCDTWFGSVYMNGSIYQLTSNFMLRDWVNNDAVLVAFDVTSEIFRSITIPNLILRYFKPNVHRSSYLRLLEVDGHIAIAYTMGYNVKLWVCRENAEYDIKGKKPKSTNLGSREAGWTEDTITLPFPSSSTLWWLFYTGAGKHQILVQYKNLDAGGIDSVTQYSYDLKKKMLTKIEVCGIPSSIPDDCCINLLPTFVESLFPIQKQRSISGVPHSNIQQERDSCAVV